MKIFFVFLLFTFTFNLTQSEKKKVFDLSELSVNEVKINHIDEQNLVLRFGKPLKVVQKNNEFTGESFMLYYYNGMSFEVSKNGKVTLDEINSPNIIVKYKEKKISVGCNIEPLLKEFPKDFIDINEGQINILIKNTTATYFQVQFSKKIIKIISVSENY